MAGARSPRDLPSVDRLLLDPLLRGLPRDLALTAAREVLDEARAALLTDANSNGNTTSTYALDELPAQVVQRAHALSRPPLRAVINATGVIVHTNLGRAPLSTQALQAITDAAAGYANLEYDLDAGERGSRHALVTDLLRRLTGAEDALVTNNNAAALVLILSALAHGKQALISRGQLIEIGGGFRIPDVMRQSGVELLEVGSTNRTYAHDYQAAVTDRTAAIMHVHASNFVQLGFVEQASLSELARVAAEHGLVLVADLGSGSLLDTSAFGLAREPLVQESVASGAGLVAFSGDKLLGGPQSGVVVGQASLVAVLRKHPLMRAVRPDKLTLAALGTTLLHYVRGEALAHVPVWRMIAAPTRALETRARALADRLGADIVQTQSTVGGGSLPGQTQPSWAVALRSDEPNLVAKKLRRAEPPVIGRIERGRLELDLRTVLPEQDGLLERAVRAV